MRATKMMGRSGPVRYMSGAVSYLRSGIQAAPPVLGRVQDPEDLKLIAATHNVKHEVTRKLRDGGNADRFANTWICLKDRISTWDNEQVLSGRCDSISKAPRCARVVQSDIFGDPLNIVSGSREKYDVPTVHAPGVC